MVGGSVELNRYSYTLCSEPRTSATEGKRLVHKILNAKGGLLIYIFFIFIGDLYSFL